MDCSKYFDLMSAALDGECTAEERRKLDTHMAVCPECAALFELLSANARAARELDCEVPADLKARIMNNLPQQEKPKKQGKIIPWKRWTPVAAAACLALVIALAPSVLSGGASKMAFDLNFSSNAPAAAEAAPGAKGTAADSDEYRYGFSADPHDAVYDAGSAAMPAEEPGTAPAEPAHYWFDNQQAICVGYSDDLSAGAQIVGSVESLAQYLANFSSQSWDSDGNPVPIAALEALQKTYTEEYFRAHRLLCVVVIAGSGSNRYEIAPQGLLRYSVTVLAEIPEVGTCDMAAWLLVAEVDGMFHDGDILDVNFIR